MNKFYFNECLPVCGSIAVFTPLLIASIKEFAKLSRENLEIDNSVVTDKLPSQLILEGLFSLQEVIENIDQKDIRTLAFSYFNKYPIESFFELNEDLTDEVLKCNYEFAVGDVSFDATNLAIVGFNSGFLFTVALHEELRRDELLIVPRIGTTERKIDNLFGEENNTNAVKLKIQSIAATKLTLFEQLLELLNNAVFTTAFKRDFLKLRLSEQSSIIDYFKAAQDRNLASPLFPDTKIVQDVSPDNSKCSVYELRVYRPKALRVYFSELPNAVLLASIGAKSNPDQASDIRKAHASLYKLLMTL